MTTETAPATTITAPATETPSPATETAKSEPVPADVQEYLKSKGLTDEPVGTEPRKEEAQTPGEGEGDAEYEKAIDALAEAKAAKLVESKAADITAKAAEEKNNLEHKQRLVALGETYRTRTTRLSNTMNAILRGEVELTPEIGQAIVNEFNSHHANAQELLWDANFGMLAEMLPEEARPAFLTGRQVPQTGDEVASAFTAIKDALTKEARKGYIPADGAEAKAIAAHAVVLYRKYLQDSGQLSSERGTGRAVGATGAGVNSTRVRTQAEADTLHIQGKITGAERERIRQDKSIPLGY